MSLPVDADRRPPRFSCRRFIGRCFWLYVCRWCLELLNISGFPRRKLLYGTCRFSSKRGCYPHSPPPPSSKSKETSKIKSDDDDTAVMTKKRRKEEQGRRRRTNKCITMNQHAMYEYSNRKKALSGTVEQAIKSAFGAEDLSVLH